MATNDGATPLSIAAQEGHIEMVQALLSAGVDHTKQVNPHR